MAAPILTNTYAGLKGWQWIAVIGAGGGLVLYLRSRSAAASSSASGDASGDASSPVPAGSENGNPITTIIEQQGAASTAAPTAPTAPASSGTTTPTATLPKVNAGSWAQKLPGVPGPAWIKIGHVDASGKYSGSNVSGGVPVFAYSSGTHQFYQGWSGATAKNHDIYIPAQYAAYVVK